MLEYHFSPVARLLPRDLFPYSGLRVMQPVTSSRPLHESVRQDTRARPLFRFHRVCGNI